MSQATSGVDDAFLAAESLNVDQKLELISRLWEDVRRSGNFRPSDAALEEVKRRWAEYEAGKMKAVPWEEVRDSVRLRLKEHG
ncbi:MAG: addiction module protein [Pirellulales bacterium]